MANLETLELTINANAESASKGLGSLIGSLSSLSQKTGQATSALQALSKELEKIKGIGNIKLPEVMKGFSSNSSARRVRETTTAMQQQVEAITGISKATKSAKDSALWMDKLMSQQEFASRGKVVADTIKDQIKEQQEQIIPPSTPYTKYGMTAERWGAMSQAEQKMFEKQVRLQYQMQRETLNTKQVMEETVPAVKEVKNATADLAKTEKEVAPAMEDNTTKQKSFREGFRDLGKELKDLIPKFSLLHKVMRIGTTMLIRMGIRGLFKGIKEGFNNYYQYSKAIGTEFVQQVDGLTSSWSQLKNQMGAAIAPAIGAIIPVLNGIASAAIGAFNALSQLFALLGGKGVWSKATAQVTAFDAAAQKAGGGGGGLKEMLAKWDELNLIAQEGGGGGGGGTSAEEFASMFEEMYEFDDRIRSIANFIRETVQWVKDNMDVVLQSAILIGTAILGWKISKAFEGALGELGKLVAGGALVTLGIILDFDFGKKIGSGETLNWLDWVEGIGGIIAAGIGGYMIAGTGGLVIGIGVTIATTIVGVIVGKINKADAAKWGNVDLSADELKEFVKSKFAFDVEAQITLASGKLKNLRGAKANLDAEIRDFSSSLSKVTLSIDASPVAIENAKADMDTVISAMQEYAKAEENMLTTYFDIMPYEESDEKDVIKNVFKNNQKLTEYVKGKGAEIAKLFDQGMKNQWKGSEQEQIKALMEHVNNIFAAFNDATQTSKAKNLLKLSMKDLTRDSAEAVLAEQKRILKEYEQVMRDSMLEQVATLEGFAAAAEAAGMKEVAKQYREDAKKLADGFDEALRKRLNELKDPLKAEWTEVLKDAYGGSLSTAVSGLANTTEFRNATMKGSKEAAELLKKELDTAISKNKLLKEATDLYGISGWDLLADNTKQKYIETFKKAFGNEAMSALKKILKVPMDEIVTFYGYDNMSKREKGNFVSALINTYSPNVVGKKIALFVTDLVTILGYDKMTTAEKLNFVNALKDAYGAKDALDAAKQAGINVAEAVRDGLSGKNPEAKAAATELAKAVDDALKEYNIKLPIDADITVKIETLLELKTEIETKTPVEGVIKSTQTAETKNTSVHKPSKPIAVAKAGGAYGIDRGDIFIANEAGAELVGSINGKTSVANQEQIIEGIQRGVAEANESQNALLRQQNELLRGILAKETNVNFGASAAFGRTVRQSLDMYTGMTGG